METNHNRRLVDSLSRRLVRRAPGAQKMLDNEKEDIAISLERPHGLAGDDMWHNFNLP